MGVYFIRANGTNFVKVGHSNNIHRRLLSLQGASPHKLQLIGVIESGGPQLEAIIHDYLSEHRVRGEWFSLTDEITKNALKKYGAQKHLRQEQPTIKDLQRAIAKEPELTDFGFGIWDGHDSREYQKIFNKDRKALSNNIEHFVICCNWLSLCRKIKTPTWSSYYLKHCAERYFDSYVTNGAFIAAVIHQEIPYSRIEQLPNAAVGISSASVKELGGL